MELEACLVQTTGCLGIALRPSTAHSPSGEPNRAKEKKGEHWASVQRGSWRERGRRGKEEGMARGSGNGNGKGRARKGHPVRAQKEEATWRLEKKRAFILPYCGR